MHLIIESTWKWNLYIQWKNNWRWKEMFYTHSKHIHLIVMWHAFNGHKGFTPNDKTCIYWLNQDGNKIFTLNEKQVIMKRKSLHSLKIQAFNK